jgi:hypothetical protein
MFMCHPSLQGGLQFVLETTMRRAIGLPRGRQQLFWQATAWVSTMRQGYQCCAHQDIDI